MLKLSGRGGGTTSGLPTEFQREPSLGSQVPMLVLAARPLARLRASPHLSAATSAVSQPNQPLPAAASRTELVCQPACTPPAGLPSLSRVPRRTGTWRCPASRRLVWSPWSLRPRRFCAPLAAVSQPQLGLRSEPHNQKFQRSPPWPYRTTLKLWLWGSERQAR